MSFISASAPGAPAPPLDPGHAYARTSHIAFTFHKQQASPAPFGYEYFLSLPPGYEAQPDRKWPLLLFLHGAGESQRARGESYASIRHGVPKIILCYDKLKAGEPAPTHIDIPRPPRGKRWRQDPSDLSPMPVPAAVCERVAESCITLSPSLDVTHGYGWNPRVLGALLDEVVRAHRVDADAVHVTGFSMGGYGTWALALATPNRFASVVPICGGGEVALAKNIKHLPHWVHHGELDDIVSISESEKMVRALERAGAPVVKFTRYPELAHDSWTEAYGQLELWDWVFAQRRPSSVTGEEAVERKDNVVDVSGI